MGANQLADGLTTAHIAERLAGRLDGLVDMLVRVGRREERRLELAAREVNAAVHQVPEEAAEAGGVALLGGVVIDDQRRDEEERPHAADALELVRHPGIGRGLAKALLHLLAKLLEPGVG